jgi:hypothetical protein
MTITAPGNALVISAVKSTHAGDLVAQYGELALDTFLTTGAFKDVPIIGSVIGLYKAGLDLRSQLFIKKLLHFLEEADGMSQTQRDAFYQKLSSEEAEKLGETTLSILDKCDSDIQAKMLGRAFVRLMEGSISRSTFELYAFAIRDLNRYHVIQIKQVYSTPGLMIFDPVAATYLSMHGIMNVVTSNRISNGQTMDKSFEQTSFGQDFYNHVIK